MESNVVFFYLLLMVNFRTVCSAISKTGVYYLTAENEGRTLTKVAVTFTT